MSTLTKLIISLPPDHNAEDSDRLLALLALHISHGWEEQSLATGELQCIVHCTQPEFCEDFAEEVRMTLPSTAVTLSCEETPDWVEAWKEFFTPVQGGRHFLVVAPWMERERARTGRIPIIIEPKTAFGTGHHATTALCLGAVSTLYGEGRLQRGMRFLDLGTGSGILGIACARLGLSGDGLDIDPPAVENSEENRELNGVAPEQFRIALGSVETARGPYDLILANILAEPLHALAPQIAALPGPDGARPLLVLSGILDRQADGIAERYVALGFSAPRRLIQEEWAALIFA